MSYKAKEPLDGHRPDASIWKTGFWLRFPWAGMLSLLSTIIAIAFMLYIVRTSDGQPIDHWYHQPTVYLSITYTIANIALQFALAQAVTMTWWIKALKGEAKIRELHNIWAFGTGFTNILTSGRSFNFVALAGLAVTLVPVNGPLLQRSTVVKEQTVIAPQNLTIPVALEFPGGYTGDIAGRMYKPTSISAGFGEILKRHGVSQSINITNSGCEGICKGKLQGAGYEIRCTNESMPFTVDLQAYWDKNETLTYEMRPFESNFTFSQTGEYILNFTATFKVESACASNWTVSQCTLRPATMEYPIILSNDTITLDPEGSWKTDRVMALRPPPPEDAGIVRGPITHGGMYLALISLWSDIMVASYDGVTGWRGAISSTVISRYVNNIGNMTSYGDEGGCQLSFFDPTYDAMADVRELSFRSALYIASANVGIQTPRSRLQNLTRAQWEETYSQTIGGQQTSRRVIYQSQYGFLAAAVAITMLATFCVLILSLGWWHLGREVSLSPIEIAKAFAAPTLQGANSNAKASKILKEMGNERVSYGTAWDDAGSRDVATRTMRIDWAGRCEPPRSGQVIG
jgi:hypothetical protein